MNAFHLPPVRRRSLFAGGVAVLAGATLPVFSGSNAMAAPSVPPPLDVDDVPQLGDVTATLPRRSAPKLAPQNQQPVTETWLEVPGLGRCRGLTLAPIDTWTPKLSNIVSNPSYVPAPGTTYDNVPYNDAGVPLWRNKFTGVYMVHPVYATSIFSVWMDHYRASGDRTWLKKTIRGMKGLNLDSELHQIDGRACRFLPYRFDWSDRYGPVSAPWYTAFSNSRMLNLAVQLWFHTRDAAWRTLAAEYLNAYFVPHLPSDKARPWFMGTDDQGYLWFDMYPTKDGRLSKVFNGQASGWHGVHVYDAIIGDDPRAKLLHSAMFATALHYASTIRVPGNCSRYYADSTEQVPSYHRVNVDSLRSLWDNSGHLPFVHLMDDLCRDYVSFGERNGGGELCPLWATTYYVHRVCTGDALAPGPISTWRPPWRGTRATVASRYRFAGQAATWLLMKDGPRANWWVQETAENCYMLAPAAHMNRVGLDLDIRRPGWRGFSALPIPVLFKANQLVTAYTYDWAGNVKAKKQGRWRWDSRALSDGRAHIRGRDHYRILNGAFAGMWVPADRTKVAYVGQ